MLRTIVQYITSLLDIHAHSQHQHHSVSTRMENPHCTFHFLIRQTEYESVLFFQVVFRRVEIQNVTASARLYTVEVRICWLKHPLLS